MLGFRIPTHRRKFSSFLCLNNHHAKGIAENTSRLPMQVPRAEISRLITIFLSLCQILRPCLFSLYNIERNRFTEPLPMYFHHFFCICHFCKAVFFQKKQIIPLVCSDIEFFPLRPLQMIQQICPYSIPAEILMYIKK